MTWGTSHLGISVLLVLIFSTKEYRAKMFQNRTLLLLVSLGAVFPDLDLLVGVHRTWSHSIFYPLIILFFIHTITISKGLKEKYPKIFNPETRFYLNLFVILWLTHMFYDSSFGPLAIFFPFDTTLYDIQGGVLLNLSTFILSVAGLFIEITPVNPLIGSNVFFTNWTPDQRIQYFQTNILQYPILDFFLHLTIFLVYLRIIVLPVLDQQISHRYPKFTVNWIRFSPATFSPSILRSLIIIGLIIAFTIVGPVQGNSQNFNTSSSLNVKVLTEQFQPYQLSTVSYPTGAQVTSELNLPATSLQMSYIWGLVNQSKFDSIKTQLDALIKQMGVHNVSQQNYTGLFKSYLNEILYSNSTISPTTQVSKISFSINVNESKYKTGFVFGLFLIQWNSTESFDQNFQLNTVFTIYRSPILFQSYVLILTLFVLLILINKDLFKRKNISSFNNNYKDKQ